MFDTQDLQQGAAPTDAYAALPAGGSQPAHLLDRLSAIFKHRRLAAAAFFIVVAVMMLQTYSTVPMYRAGSRVMISDERTVAVGNLNANDPMFWQDAEQFYNTQYSIVRSRALARRVVDRLELQNHPLFNGSAPPRRGPLTALHDAREALSRSVRRVLGRESAAGAAEAPSPDETAVERALVNQFLGGIEVVPEKGTRFVEIVYRSSDAYFSALAANTLAEEYAQLNLDLRLETIRKNLLWLGEEVKKQEKKVTDAETAMTSYREEQNALSLESRQNIVVQRLNALNDTVTKARTARLQKEATYNQIRNVDPASDDADAYAVIATNPGVLAAKERLTELTAERTKLAARYLPNHPDMQKTDTQIRNATANLHAQRQRVIESARNEYQAALAEERSFAGSLEDQKSQAMDLDRKSGAYLVLQRQADSDRQIWQSLLQQEKELRVISNSRQNNVQVMDLAEVPGAPYSPNARRDWFYAMITGVLVAFGLAFGIEYLDDTVKTPEDVSKRLRLPLLGLVPAIRGSRVPLLSEPVPHDFGEAFRSLRTSLVFTAGSEGPRIIAVTSSQPLEGKTTTACNLAMALALGGSRVLLIDADMRRPGLHKVVGVENTVGLSHLIVGQVRVRDAVQRTSEDNLFVIPAGRTPPNPSELLASDRMKSFLANLSTGPFDWVIIDTPPVLAVTDAVIVARMVSGVVFVVGSEMTRRVHAERALETIFTGKPQSVGAVLNRVDLERNKYYYSRYYGYHYKNYYQSSAA